MNTVVTCRSIDYIPPVGSGARSAEGMERLTDPKGRKCESASDTEGLDPDPPGRKRLVFGPGQTAEVGSGLALLLYVDKVDGGSVDAGTSTR